jgi:hypothetical protein
MGPSYIWETEIDVQSNRGPILKSTSTDVTCMWFYFVTWWMLVKFAQQLYHCIFYKMNAKRQSFRQKFSTPDPRFVHKKADQRPSYLNCLESKSNTILNGVEVSKIQNGLAVDAFKQFYVDFHVLFYAWFLIFMQPITICYATHFPICGTYS